MLNFKIWLTEGSYIPEEIPPYFYCACKLNMHGLVKMKLHGLDGISATPYILEKFWGGIRSVALKMPSQDLLKLNNLSKILYNNPDYLFSKGADAYKRLTAHKPGNVWSKPAHIIGIYDTSSVKELNDYIKDSKNVNDLVNKMLAFLKLKTGKTMDRNIVKNKVLEILGDGANYGYGDEQEWRIKPQWQRIEEKISKIHTLKLPNTTEIMIAHYGKNATISIMFNTINPPTTEEVVKLEAIYKKVSVVDTSHHDSHKYVAPFATGTVETNVAL